MEKLKIALLEDNFDLLKDFKRELEDTGLVDILFFAQTGSEFIKKMESFSPDALLLDIDLAGESINGLYIASKYRLPVLFVSGKTNEFNTQLEDLDNNYDFPVMRLRKTRGQDLLLRTLKKFINEICSLQKSQTHRLKLLYLGWQNIPVDCIVFMTSDGETSNNKEIYFTDRVPDVLVNFSFKRLKDFGFDPEIFLRVNKQRVVNKNNIADYRQKEHKIVVKAMNNSKKEDQFTLEISEDYRPVFRKLFN
jgi:CheY-like chemotaxis protein